MLYHILKQELGYSLFQAHKKGQGNPMFKHGISLSLHLKFTYIRKARTSPTGLAAQTRRASSVIKETDVSLS